jgi:nicotinamidase-related amidase
VLRIRDHGYSHTPCKTRCSSSTSSSGSTTTTAIGPLVLLLRVLEVEPLVIAGAATERCVVQSAIDAREVGFKVTVLADACATADDEMETLALTYAERIVGAFVGEQRAWQPGQSD